MLGMAETSVSGVLVSGSKGVLKLLTGSDGPDDSVVVSCIPPIRASYGSVEQCLYFNTYQYAIDTYGYYAADPVVLVKNFPGATPCMPH
jgi:hypothetical protein